MEFEKLRRKVEEKEENQPNRSIFGVKPSGDKRIPMTKNQKQTIMKQMLSEQIQRKRAHDLLERAQELEIDKINLEKANIGLSLEFTKQKEERTKEM